MIINKKRSLTTREFKEIMEHTRAGYQILSSIRFPWSEIPLMAKSHHEKLDGQGYPDGLKGDQISLGAKIICLADAFDAMTSSRPYRKGLGLEAARAEISRCAGTQFDPHVVDALAAIGQAGLEAIARLETRPL